MFLNSMSEIEIARAIALATASSVMDETRAWRYHNFGLKTDTETIPY